MLTTYTKICFNLPLPYLTDIALDTKYVSDLIRGTISNKFIHYEDKGKKLSPELI